MTEADRSGFGNGGAGLEAEAVSKENSASSAVVPTTERESRGRFGGVFQLVPPPLIVAGLAYLAVSQAPNVTSGAKAIMANCVRGQLSPSWISINYDNVRHSLGLYSAF